MPSRTSTRPIPEAVDVAVDELWLDPKNPRLASLHFEIDQQVEILRVLWKEMAVSELVDSIAASGYWKHEEIFATLESGCLIVIEGNRRVAAVKLLIDADLRRRVGTTNIPDLPATAKTRLAELPVVTCSREQIWEYVGFKHVNGPQEWDSIAKAQYIARVRNDFNIPLETIAKTIGDRHDTVKRLYRGLMVLEQAESEGIFNREDRWNRRFSYSHLWTGLGYAGVQSFLGLDPDGGFKRNPVSRRRVRDLGDLLLWMYGSKQRNQKPLIESQNPDLRNLDEVLRNKSGIAALRTGLPLEVALKASRGDERLLRESIVKAEVALKETLGLIPTGYSQQSDLFEAGKRIRTLAENVYEAMAESSSEEHQKRRTPRTK